MRGCEYSFAAKYQSLNSSEGASEFQKILKDQLQKGQPPPRNKDGSTVLHVAALQREWGSRITRGYVTDESTKDLINVQNNKGVTAIMVAGRHANLDGGKTVKCLVEAKADPDLQDKQGNSALHWTEHLDGDQNLAVETFKCLVETGGANVDVQNAKGDKANLPMEGCKMQ